MKGRPNCPKCGGKGWILKGHGEDEQCDCIFVEPPESTPPPAVPGEITDTMRVDWWSKNPSSVRYIAPHWYSGYDDPKSLNPEPWSSTGQWPTLRAAIDAAMSAHSAEKRAPVAGKREAE